MLCRKIYRDKVGGISILYRWKASLIKDHGIFTLCPHNYHKVFDKLERKAVSVENVELMKTLRSFHIP